MYQDAPKRPVLLSMAALGPEALIMIGPIPITNTVLGTLLVDAILLGSALYVAKHMKKIPGTFQNLMEFVIDTFYKLTESISGKNAAKIFPWFLTFFLFILISNWSGLIPGHGSIGFYQAAGASDASHGTPPEESHGEATTPTTHTETTDDHTSTDNHAVTDDHAPVVADHTATTNQTTEEHTVPAEEEAAHEEPHLIPILRNGTSDLNVTLALAIISLIATHTLAIRATGIKDYLARFFSFNPILLFVGLLEIISEFTKLISLSFRLFGNIFAGEVVLGTTASLFAFVFPVPFMLLEVIVGLVQALVFSMLTMVFMSVLMTPHHAEEHAKEVSH